jgi:glycerol-3-phosphate dehydrogenase
MAEDAINQAAKLGGLPEKDCVTEDLKIHGAVETKETQDDLNIYGSDAQEIDKLIAENPDLAEKLHEDLPYRKAEIVWAVRHEMAQTIEDVLARRTRALFLNAKAAINIAPQVAEIMAEESNKESAEIWIQEQIQIFGETAQHYLVKSSE